MQGERFSLRLKVQVLADLKVMSDDVVSVGMRPLRLFATKIGCIVRYRSRPWRIISGRPLSYDRDNAQQLRAARGISARLLRIQSSNVSVCGDGTFVVWAWL